MQCYRMWGKIFKKLLVSPTPAKNCEELLQTLFGPNVVFYPNWELYLYAFQVILPYFMKYNHTNYDRWGTLYISEMHHLPPDVLQKFQSGNFVVRRSSHQINQVDPHQSQEWLNVTGKKKVA